MFEDLVSVVTEYYGLGGYIMEDGEPDKDGWYLSHYSASVDGVGSLVIRVIKDEHGRVRRLYGKVTYGWETLFRFADPSDFVMFAMTIQGIMERRERISTATQVIRDAEAVIQKARAERDKDVGEKRALVNQLRQWEL